MSAEPRLKVVLCWHMHQPGYQDLASGRYRLPWVYLHAIKDYVDMAAILEENPAARAVVNFAPILLDQIEDYARQVAAHLQDGEALRDPLLAALTAETFSGETAPRRELIEACLRANEERLIKRFAPYERLSRLAALALEDPDGAAYLDDRYLADLVTWYHLAWLGETVRRGDRRVQSLLEKGRGFTPADRRVLMEVIGTLLATVVGRYRALAEAGRVELSMTPYAHPMLPLMLDFRSACEAICDISLPRCAAYPGGAERAHWHLREGLDCFRRHFGFAPQGCWPAEGGVSADLLALLGEYDFKWVASGEAVLRNSLARCEVQREQPMEEKLHRAYRVGETAPVCFFRDDGLSDLIGFTYASWHADDAVANLVHHLENIADCCRDDDQRVVAIILDGENAWETYPENGYHFLTALYQRLASHPRLRLTTFAECLAQGLEVGRLPVLTAGSWVYGTFSTWIGDPDKNRAWEMLCEAKQVFDEAFDATSLGDEARRRALSQLAVCEGSDWFWWFGDYNPAETVSDFERLFRLHLANLYRFLGRPVPAQLGEVLSTGGGAPEMGGVMRPGQPPDASPPSSSPSSPDPRAGTG